MSPRPVELRFWHVRIPFKKTIRHASYTRNQTDSLIVCCRLSDGTEGWGEGLPRPYVTGDTIDSAFEMCQRTDWAAQIGVEFDTLQQVVEACARLEPAITAAPARDCSGNPVRCAVELSLLDAACRVAGAPLAEITRLLPEAAAIASRQTSVRYSAALTPSTPARDWINAWKLKFYGFRQCKLKVGVERCNDAALLRMARRVLGRACDLRIDANEAWHCGQLEEKLAPLMPYNVSLVEQPVPHAEVDCLAALRPRLRIPVMLDESLCSLSDGRKAIERGTCDLFNIRLSKCGGFVRSLKLAAMAHAAGLGYQLGCQVGETGILSAAGRHFAASVGGIRYLEGSYDRHLVRESLTREDLTFGYGGRAGALTAPGLSITIDRAALERVRVRELAVKL
jgi:muconate cycloisomerase